LPNSNEASNDPGREPDVPLVVADTLPPLALYEAFMAAFADYLIGPFQVPAAEWPNVLARHGVDLARSRAVVADGRIVAFAQVAPRPDIRRWRLAAMGALPAARGTGAAPRLLDDFIARARESGVAEVELECFERNERAFRLYRGRGFEVRHRLNGWSWPAQQPAGERDALAIRTLDRDAAMDWLEETARRIPDLPLQTTAASLRGSPRHLQAGQAGDAQLVFSLGGEAADAPVTVHSLIDRDPGLAGARALAKALPAAHPGRAISVPALFRDDIGGAAFREAGYRAFEFSQVLMVRAL
jgi:ribosomal protein S18 acetylase RimI-like enzyme